MIKVDNTIMTLFLASIYYPEEMFLSVFTFVDFITHLFPCSM